MRKAMLTVGMLALLGLWGEGRGVAKEVRTRSSATKRSTEVRLSRSRPKRPLTRKEKIRLFKQMVREMGRVGKDCRFKGKRLWGKVKVVKSFPDFKVKVVRSFPDLKVKWVSSFPTKCGLWKKVTSFPDFKIKYVTSFPDFTIKIVTSFPGVK